MDNRFLLFFCLCFFTVRGRAQADTCRIMIMVHVPDSAKNSVQLTLNGQALQADPSCQCYWYKGIADSNYTIAASAAKFKPVSFVYNSRYRSHPVRGVSITLGTFDCQYLLTSSGVTTLYPDSLHVVIAGKPGTLKADTVLTRLAAQHGLRLQDMESLEKRSFPGDHRYGQTSYYGIVVSRINGEPFLPQGDSTIALLQQNGYTVTLLPYRNQTFSYVGRLTILFTYKGIKHARGLLEREHLDILDFDRGLTYRVKTAPGMGIGLFDLMNRLYESGYIEWVEPESYAVHTLD